MADEVVLPIPNLSLPQNLFVLSLESHAPLHDAARKELLEGIKADQMGPYYKSITSSLPALQLDQALLDSMEKANAEELKRLDERLAEAEKQEGESEISDALKARANYLTRIGDKDGAVAAQKLALEKTPGLGSRIDIVLTLVRIGFFFGDHTLVIAQLAKAEELIEKGGDWDRRNRLKVYQGLHLISIRQFKRAGELLNDALSTFTATELLSYNDFVAYTVIACALTLSRVDLKKKVIAAPEVNQVLPEIPVLGDLIKNLYDCHYDKFFIALATLEQTHLLPSRILSPHARYYVREMRILAYNQLLESYRSLTLESLSAAFGVSVDFVDRELSRFIANGRLHCKIDKVNGIVETTRPSLKNAQYETVVRQGDILLNSVQRLTAPNDGENNSNFSPSHHSFPKMSSASSYQPVSRSDRSIPFYWLPEDVLIKIFKEALTLERAGGGYRLYSHTINHPLTMRLSYVSRRFRQVTLECPSLWKTIDSEVFPSTSFTTAFILRSRDELLDVEITKDYLTENIFNLLLSCIHRWQSFSLGADDSNRGTFQKAMDRLGDRVAPKLERLSIGSSFKAPAGGEGWVTNILNQGAPSLKSLELMTHTLFLPTNRDHITHLSLTAPAGSAPSLTYSQFGDILSSFPSLTDLKLVGKMAKDWPAIPEIQPLRSSQLKSLYLSLPDDYDSTGDLPHHYIFSMLATLTTETLQNLTITGFPTDTIKTFLRHLRRGNLRFPNVRWLCWYDDLDEAEDEDLAAITKYFPKVETLTFMEQDTFLEYLSTNPSAWPNLRSLNGCHVEVPILRKIVSSRVSAAQPVNDVWLEGRWLERTSDLSWIRKRVKLTTGVFHQMPTWRLVQSAVY